jgi:hypothetical protein
MSNDAKATDWKSQLGTARPRQISIEHLWLVLPIFVQIIFGFRKQLNVLDFWWHLKVGDLILETKSLMRVDEFSFTALGSPFILQNWLAEVLYSLVHRVGGFEGLIFFNTMLLTAALIPIYSLCLQATRRIRPAALCMVLTLFVMPAFSWVRPQGFSVFLFATFLWVLSQWTKGNSRHLWFLPVAMLLWVNLHGAFVLGLGLVFLFLSLEGLRRVALGQQSDTQPYCQITTLSIAFGLTCLATLANPELHRVYEYVMSVARDAGSQLYVTEWQSPSIARVDGVLCFFAPFMLSLLVLLFTKRKLTLTELALYMGFAVFGLVSLRNGIWFALVVPTIVAPAIMELPPAKGLGAWGKRLLSSDRPRTASTAQRPALNLMMALILFAALVIYSPWVYQSFSGVPIWNPKTPISAMDYVDEHNLKGNIFHPQYYGDYLIWRLWPKQRTFIDGRVHVFGQDHVEDYLTTYVDSCWEQRLEKHDIRYLLLSKDENEKELSQQLVEKAKGSPNWQQIYEDELSVIFEKIAEVG